MGRQARFPILEGAPVYTGRIEDLRRAQEKADAEGWTLEAAVSWAVHQGLAKVTSTTTERGNREKGIAPSRVVRSSLLPVFAEKGVLVRGDIERAVKHKLRKK